MKNFLLLSIFALLLVSCGSTKNTGKVPEAIIGSSAKSKTTHRIGQNENNSTSRKTKEICDIKEIETVKPKETRDNIIDFAKTFQGTRYKFGGTTKAGMDCSGLVFTAFKTENITLPRISRDMATKGILISFKDIEEGDLVFFKTTSKNTITHVGLVVESKRGEVKFIHSTTQAGVIISSMEEAYWKKAFVEVRRII
ncbi:MAG TPA: C40 family peptidase [Flavobacteriaceae bacterium]|nr:C40 family peptidase [Flavobacteriaceae bacterium]